MKVQSVTIESGIAKPEGSSLTVSGGEETWVVQTNTISLLAGLATTALESDSAIGCGYFDPTNYATLTLEAIGLVVSGVTGTLELYSVNSSSVVATLTWTETAYTRKTSSVTLPVSATIYELRIRKSGGGAEDYALFSSIRLTAN